MIELFHGYTYSGHPVAAAAGLATMDVYEEEGTFEQASARAAVRGPAAFVRRSRQGHRRAQYRPDGRHRTGAARRRARRTRPRDPQACFWEENLMSQRHGHLQISPFLNSKLEDWNQAFDTIRRVIDRSSNRSRGVIMNARPAENIDTANIVGHFINGQDVADATGPSPYQSGDRRSYAARRDGVASDRRRRHRGRRSGVSRLAQHAAGETRRVMFRFKQLARGTCRRNRRAITNEHGKVSTMRWASSFAASRSSSTPAAFRRCSKASIRRTSARRSTAGRRSSRSALLPASRRSTSRRWCPCGCTRWQSPAATRSYLKPSEKDPDGADACARLLQGSRAAGRRFQPRQRRQGSRRYAAQRRARAGRQLSSARRRSPSTSIDGHGNGKRVQALGGAKNHAIVMPDADIDNAVSALMGAAYGSCGERCMAISVAVCVGDERPMHVVGKFKERLPT